MVNLVRVDYLVAVARMMIENENKSTRLAMMQLIACNREISGVNKNAIFGFVSRDDLQCVSRIYSFTNVCIPSATVPTQYTRRPSPVKMGDIRTTDGSQQRFAAQDFAQDHKHHILLAASGSVATIKIPMIAQALAKHDKVSIRLVLTSSAAEFLRGQSAEQPQLERIKRLPNVDAVYLDEDEWSKPWIRGDKILHIELRRWAHVLLIAPLSANSLAKMANGLSDNLLLSVIRAWDTTGVIDGQKKMIFVAPAMNSAMWRHPVTSKHIKTLKSEWGSAPDGWVRVLGPVEKGLACGDVGDGGMMEWSSIVAELEGFLGLNAT